MKWLLLVMVMMLTPGCPKYTVCPAPKDVPPLIVYQTVQMPETMSSADIIKTMLADLVTCQDVEGQLRLILKGYEK